MKACMAPEGLAAGEDHVVLEDFAVPWRVPGMKARISWSGKRGVDLGPARVGVGDEGAVLHNLRGQAIVPVLGREGEVGALAGRGEDDAVIADSDLGDLGHAVGGAGLELAGAQGTRGARDVELVSRLRPRRSGQTGGGATAFHDRGREVEVLAEGSATMVE
jgi:hypothetical protein